MTLAELARAVKSWERVEKRKAQEKAAFDYVNANLIGRSIASYFSKDITMPELAECFPSLFIDESQKKKEEKEKLQAELSALRFRKFADAYNKKYYGKGCELDK